MPPLASIDIGSNTLRLLIAEGRTSAALKPLRVERRITRLGFPNPEKIVRPGQYGRVRFVSETLKGGVCVPQKADSELQGVYQIVVIGADRKAEIRTVKMGPRFGDLWVVSEGLKAGETAVVEGLQQVKPGAEVVAKPIEELAAKAAAAPAGK